VAQHIDIGFDSVKSRGFGAFHYAERCAIDASALTINFVDGGKSIKEELLNGYREFRRKSPLIVFFRVEGIRPVETFRSKFSRKIEGGKKGAL